MIAHNYRLKGLQELIAATASIDTAFRDKFRIVVVGKGRRWSFRKLAKEMGIADQLTFVGPSDVPEEYYAAADVYCQPTYYDPCSLTVMEAMSSGLPVITTRYNGVGELIENGREGYVLDRPDNIGEFVRHLESLVEPALRVRMGDAGRQVALDHTLQRNFKEMMAVFERAAIEVPPAGEDDQ